jgi:hypothetical protein
MQIERISSFEFSRQQQHRSKRLAIQVTYAKG